MSPEFWFAVKWTAAFLGIVSIVGVGIGTLMILARKHQLEEQEDDLHNDWHG